MRTATEPTTDITEPITRPPLPETPPSPEPRHEPGNDVGPEAVRIVEHAGPYDLRGMPVWCAECSARRDWAFIGQGRNVWIACRCGTVWHEPEMGRRDIDALYRPGGPTYPTVRQALAAMGRDGTFRGLYFT
ncbi:hypothetical protein [Streptomyces sp. NPDC047046]|uniref:hypothetical protein n=1 Tax=Streptomyces sp. NPDC047046 TaxID=3155378 RepID=UPI0033CD3E32